MIVAAAIMLSNGMIFVGKRHNDCFTNATKILKLETPTRLNNAIQGFLTSSGQFLSRVDAYYHAYTSDQCERQIPLDTSHEEWQPSLTSEDLW